MNANPFKPTAGKMPPILIGRESVIADFEEGLENGAGAPGRLMVITGQRGFGKTVMLTELGKIAESHGWFVISETASEGLASRIVDTLEAKKARISEAEFAPAISMAGTVEARLGSMKITRDVDALTLRMALEKRLSKIKDGRGIFINVDETQAAQRDDLVAIATAVQHIIRTEDMRNVSDERKKGIALVFAGLPSIIDDVLNDEALTFLRRSLQRNLGDIPVLAIRDAYVETVTQSGKSISSDVALEAARATSGYPYLIQLVGYYMWQAAHRRGSDAIEIEDVESAQNDAIIAFGDAVCAPALKTVSKQEQRFLKAMAQDSPDPTRTSEIAERMGVSKSSVNNYRNNLLHARLIEEAEYGYVAFTIPYMGKYLKDVAR